MASQIFVALQKNVRLPLSNQAKHCLHTAKRCHHKKLKEYYGAVSSYNDSACYWRSDLHKDLKFGVPPSFSFHQYDSITQQADTRNLLPSTVKLFLKTHDCVTTLLHQLTWAEIEFTAPKEVSKVSGTEMSRHIFFWIHNTAAESLLVGLALENLLLDAPRAHQAVHKAGFFLAISPHTCHGLCIVGWVPVRVKHYQPGQKNKSN